MYERSALNHCVAADYCAANVIGGQPCGSEAFHLPASLPPGEVCINAVWGRFEAAYEGLALGEPYGRTLTRRAGLLIDLAMSRQVTDEESSTYLDSASADLDAAQQTPRILWETLVTARLLSLYLPNFVAYRQSADPADWGTTQNQGAYDIQRMRALMTEVRNAPFHGPQRATHVNDDPNHIPCFISEDQRRGVYTRLAFFRLCQEAGLDFLPAINRHSPTCHLYVFHEGKVIPTKVVSDTSSKHAPPMPGVAVISFKTLVEHSSRRSINDLSAPAGGLLPAERVARWLETGEVPEHPRTDTQRVTYAYGKLMERMTGKLIRLLKSRALHQNGLG